MRLTSKKKFVQQTLFAIKTEHFPNTFSDLYALLSMAWLVLVKPLVCILNLRDILVYSSFALEGKISYGVLALDC